MAKTIAIYALARGDELLRSIQHPSACERREASASQAARRVPDHVLIIRQNHHPLPG